MHQPAAHAEEFWQFGKHEPQATHNLSVSVLSLNVPTHTSCISPHHYFLLSFRTIQAQSHAYLVFFKSFTDLNMSNVSKLNHIQEKSDWWSHKKVLKNTVQSTFKKPSTNIKTQTWRVKIKDGWMRIMLRVTVSVCSFCRMPTTYIIYMQMWTHAWHFTYTVHGLVAPGHAAKFIKINKKTTTTTITQDWQLSANVAQK